MIHLDIIKCYPGVLDVKIANCTCLLLYSMLRLFQRKEIALISFVFVKLFTVKNVSTKHNALRLI